MKKQKNSGKILKFLFLPDEHDPSSLLEEEGRDEFEERIEKAMVLSDYIFRLILNKYGDSIEEKAAASKAVSYTHLTLPTKRVV